MYKKLFQLSLALWLGFSCLVQTKPVHAVAETARLFDDANEEHFTITDNTDVSVPNGTEFTIGGFFYFNSLPAGGQHVMGVWYSSNSGASAYLLWINGSTPRLQADTGGSNAVNWTSTISTGTWYFIVAGYDGTNGFIEVTPVTDTSRATRATNSGYNTADTTGNFQIGMHFDSGVGSKRPADMKAQMMFMYNGTEATSTQLDDHFNSGDGNCYDDLSDTTNMVAFWSGDESSGNLVDDHGSNTMTDVNTVTSGTGHVECAVAGASGQTIRTSII